MNTFETGVHSSKCECVELVGAGQLAGWLAAWLPGWLAGWPAGRKKTEDRRTDQMEDRRDIKQKTGDERLKMSTKR